MNRKIKNTLALFILLVLIVTAGGIYVWGIQKGKISSNKKELTKLKAKSYNKAELQKQYQALLQKSGALDSILAARKFNIPDSLSSIKFYDFITDLSSKFSEDTHVDMELASQGSDKEFNYYEYKIKGTGTYEDFYSLIYALEQSKELKKIASVSLDNAIVPDEDGIPHYDVAFTISAKVYYANDDRFTTTKLVENDLNARQVYDAFYPIIRKEVPPNVNNLLDVQGAKLLALVPEGAFLSDAKGNTFLLWEGEQVYLGYLTKIDYDNNKVNFIINKGGVIEHVDLTLEKEIKNNKNESPK